MYYTFYSKNNGFIKFLVASHALLLNTAERGLIVLKVLQMQRQD